MIFDHRSFEVESYDEQNRRTIKYIILDDEGIENESAKIMARAISLDIRGEYNFFLDRDFSNTEQLQYEWQGNLYNIRCNGRKGTVRILNPLDENEDGYLIPLDDWNEALQDWKEYYLSELGFKVSERESLNHLFGFLILAYDLWDGDDIGSEIFTEAIKKCASRYGVNSSVIYRDCRKVSGVYCIEDFFVWCAHIFDKKVLIDTELDQFVKRKIFAVISEEEFEKCLNNHIGISLYP